MKTVKEFFEANKFYGVRMTTPSGFVELDNIQANDILSGKSVSSHPGYTASSIKLDSEELLPQVIIGDITYDKKDGYAQFMTEYPERV